MKKSIFLLITLAILSCSTKTEAVKPDPTPVKEDTVYKWVYTQSIHVNMGVPFDKDTSNDYIIVRPQYVLSYNKNTGEPNWVSWELNADWYGDVDRYSGNFITDVSLPSGMTQIKHADYTNSGYDRGHMVRSEERTATVEDNKSTFLLTNIIPQMPDLNRGVWLDFEYFCEDLCKKQNKELFVISGPIIHGNATLNDAGKVTIPDSCFKIVVVLDKGQSLKDVKATTVVYAVIIPNIAGIMKDKWATYQTTVRQIEYSTGYNFLSLVPDSIEKVIEESKMVPMMFDSNRKKSKSNKKE